MQLSPSLWSILSAFLLSLFFFWRKLRRSPGDKNQLPILTPLLLLLPPPPPLFRGAGGRRRRFQDRQTGVRGLERELAPFFLSPSPPPPPSSYFSKVLVLFAWKKKSHFFLVLLFFLWSFLADEKQLQTCWNKKRGNFFLLPSFSPSQFSLLLLLFISSGPHPPTPTFVAVRKKTC